MTRRLAASLTRPGLAEADPAPDGDQRPNALHPIAVGEFDDGALLKSFARAGTGFIVAPTVLADIVCRENDLEAIGTIDAIVEHFYAVSVERREHHPAVRRILDGASAVFRRTPQQAGQTA